MNLFRKIINKIKHLFDRDYYFIVTLREIPIKETAFGKQMLLEGMEEWNRKHNEIWNDGKEYTEETWNESLNKMDIGEPRCIGFYRSKKLAERCIMENWGDWNEANYYKYALIYHIKGEGLYNFTNDVQWYEAKASYEYVERENCSCLINFDCHKCENKTPNTIYLWS